MRYPAHWTASQHALYGSPYALTVWWGANGIGKSSGLAELARRAIGGLLPWQEPGPQSVILAGNTWAQLGSTIRYLWAGLGPLGWLKGSIRYEAGGLKGQRAQIYDIVDGPGKGGELRLGTFLAANLAGPRANAVISDEPLPEDVYSELWGRLLGRNGRMYMGFTPTLGTAHKLEYLWRMVDDPLCPWAGQIQTELTLEAVTPIGSAIPTPWMTRGEIERFAEGCTKVQADMRLGRSRVPVVMGAFFSAWGAHLLSEARPPGGTPIGVGIDHGSRPGAQRAVLVAVSGQGIRAQVWVLDEYQGDGRTESEQDARGILDMLTRQGLRLEDVDYWVGDRAHGGDRRGGKKSNARLREALASAVGIDTTRPRWWSALPRPLRDMNPPRKYEGSVWERCEAAHRWMVGDAPRLHVHHRCVALHEDLSLWEGRWTDPHKDGIDAFTYVAVPMAEPAFRR